MSEYGKIQKQLMTDIADAIREKKATTAVFAPAQMATEIRGIVTGDDLPDAEGAYFGSESESGELAVTKFPENPPRSETSNYSTGFCFSVNESFSVQGFEIYTGTTNGVGYEVRLFDVATKEVVASLTSDTTESGWVREILTNKVNLTVGKSYVITLSGDGKCKSCHTSAQEVGFNPKITLVGGVWDYNVGASFPKSYTSSYVGYINIIMGKPLAESVITQYKIQTETMDGLADAIREKAGVSETLTPAEMTAIVNAVNLALQEKSVLPSEETQIITPDEGYYGLSKVTVGAVDPVELPSVLDYTFGSASGMELGVTYDNPDATPSNKPGNYGSGEAGFCFVPTESVGFYGFRIKMKWSNSNATVYLWDANGNVIQSVTLTALPAGWTDVMLDAPINLFPGVKYTVSCSSVMMLGGYPTYSGKLTNCAGVYSTSGGTYPATDAMSNYSSFAITFYIGPSTDNLNPSEYEVTKTKMDELADEVKRISGATENITFEQILTALKAIPVQTA